MVECRRDQNSDQILKMKGILCICFCCLICICYAQDKTQDKTLDHLINKSVFGKAALIFVKQGVVMTDSMPVKKIDYIRKDSLVHIKFRNNRSLQLPKEEFWGLVTDYNERQRFYKDETYVVWRTRAPYIYKNVTTRNENMYYFSESLTGVIYPLLPGNIEPVIGDTMQQRVLHAFVAEHKLGQKVVYHYEPDGGSDQVLEDASALIEVICQILFTFLKQ